MELILLLCVIGLVGLAVSVGMLYLAHESNASVTNSAGGYNRQKQDDFFRRVKMNANRLR